MLLDVTPTIATVGADLFADEIKAQAIDVSPVLWRPPQGGTEEALAAVIGGVVYWIGLDSAVRAAGAKRERLFATLTQSDGPIASE